MRLCQGGPAALVAPPPALGRRRTPGDTHRLFQTLSVSALLTHLEDTVSLKVVPTLPGRERGGEKQRHEMAKVLAEGRVE